MSAPTAPPPYQPGQPSGQPRSDVAPIPFVRLVAVELRKSVNTLAGFWLVVSIGLLTLVIEGFLLILVIAQDSRSSPGDYATFAAYGLALALPVLAIMLVTGEWTQRTAMVTFALEPRRLLVLAAKYVAGLVLTLVAVVVAVVVGLLCTLVSQVFNPDATTWDLGWRLLVGVVLTQALAMSLGFALACLLLNTPAAIVVFAVYRVVPLTIFSVIAAYVSSFEKVQPYISFEYAQGPLYDLSLNGAEWAQLLVSGLIWLGLPLAFGIWRVRRAEVK